MSNNQNINLKEKFVDPVKDYLGKEGWSGSSAEINTVFKNGSDDDLKAMVAEYAGSYFLYDIFKGLKSDGGDLAMSLVAEVVVAQSKINKHHQDDIKKQVSCVYEALAILENNGSCAAMKSVLKIMETLDDLKIIDSCVDIIANCNFPDVKLEAQAVFSRIYKMAKSDKTNQNSDNVQGADLPAYLNP